MRDLRVPCNPLGGLLGPVDTCYCNTSIFVMRVCCALWVLVVYVLGMAHAGHALHAMRIALGMSQRDVARLAGTSPAQLSKVESGARVPSEKWLDAVKTALANEMHARRAG